MVSLRVTIQLHAIDQSQLLAAQQALGKASVEATEGKYAKAARDAASYKFVWPTPVRPVLGANAAGAVGSAGQISVSSKTDWRV